MPSPAFTLRIFESEYEEIQNFVMQYKNIETGGDLFGLWSRDAEPVIQLIIGPGEKCRRTSVSFHQDTDYLQNVGTYLNSSFMLCHIGSWHSHHQLSLTHPSAGDHSTVRNNFPQGLQRYIMVIANIVCTTRTDLKSVVIHPYMFTSEGRVCKPGTVQVIPNPSPFRDDSRVLSMIFQGEERYQVISKRRRRTSTPMNRTYSLGESGSAVPPKNSEIITTEQNATIARQNVVDQWYSSPEGETKLLEIHRKIRSLIQIENESSDVKLDDEILFTRNPNSWNLTLEFLHNDCKWTVEFPKSFDQDDARIYHVARNSLFSKTLLTSSKDVIESIQDICSCANCETVRNWSKANKHVNRESTENSKGFNTKQNRSFNFEESDSFNNVARRRGEDDRGIIEHSPEELRVSNVRDPEKSSRPEKSETSGHQLRTAERDNDIAVHNNHEFAKMAYGGDGERFVSVEGHTTFDRVSDDCKRGLDKDMVGNNSQTPKRNRSSQRENISTTRKDTTAHEKEEQQWYTSNQGREKLKKIHELVLSYFKPINDLEFSRKATSYNLVLEFFHSGKKWTVEFPKLFDDEEAEIKYATDNSSNLSVDAVFSRNILKAIQELCMCNDCQVEIRRGEITEHVKRGYDQKNRAKTAGTETDGQLQLVRSNPLTTEYDDTGNGDKRGQNTDIVDKKTTEKLYQRNGCQVEGRREEITKQVERGYDQKLAKARGTETEGMVQQVKSSSLTTGYEPLRYESYSPPNRNSSYSPGKSRTQHSFSPRRGSPYNRGRKRTAAVSPVVLHSTNREVELMRDRIDSFLRTSGERKVETSTNATGQYVSLEFNHSHYGWIISLRTTFSELKAKLYQRENGNRSFRRDVTSADVLETLRWFCGCRKCTSRPSSKCKHRRNNVYASVRPRKFSDD